MMKKIMAILLAAVFSYSMLFMMTSCAKKQIGVGGEGVPMAPSDLKPQPAGPSGPAGGPERGDRGADRGSIENQRLQSEIRTFESEHIYFDFDRSELKPVARVILNKKAAWLKANPDLSIRIEGNCDERGTNEYNLALGERRANAAWKFLNALGISGDRMDTISYGEEKPAVMGHDENAWSKNRRDEFKIIK